ncbi:MAG: T9SS type A sorting domain-containing protein [Paludibacteraceae bacterium]|nr:T9SS type A sorting domain-containing protein [Paludibacteraceae bacterium]
MRMKFLLYLSLFVAITTNAQVPSISYSSPQTYTVGKTITVLSPTNTGGAVPTTVPGTVTTLAGSGSSGCTNGTGTSASFFQPTSVAVDASGDVYVADYMNNMVRKITAAGVVTTLAGSTTSGNTNGTGTSASFRYPAGVAVDASGNVYVVEDDNMIRKIMATGVVTTFAGSTASGSTNGTGTSASFYNPTGVATDASGNVYVADYYNNMIRKISGAGVVTTLAGSTTSGSTNGTGTSASFNLPVDVAVDASGNVYVADFNNRMIRKITATGEVTTLAGSTASGSKNGIGTSASFYNLSGIAVDAFGNVYVADNNMIRKITSAGVVTTLAGSTTSGSTNGTNSSARFNSPTGVAVDALGNVYVADQNNNKIRKIVQTGYSITPALPAGLSLDSTGTISGTPTATSAATTYTIIATNASGSDTATVSIAVSTTTGLNNASSEKLSLSPNPATDVINVGGLTENAEIVISNLSGKILLRESLANKQSVSVVSLPKEIYIAKIQTKENSDAILFIKK